jgi:formiminotetrahydrofolate cyclodeaminase
MKAVSTYLDQLNKNLVSDFSGAILLLEAGLVGCGLNVRINAGLMSDKASGAALETEADRLEKEAASLRTSLLASVQKMYAKK